MLLYFSKSLSVRIDALFIVAVSRQCQLRFQDWPLTPQVYLLLRQFVLPGNPLESPSSDLSAGMDPRTLYVLASVVARFFSFPLNHRLPRNHQRVFTLLLGILRSVSLQRMPP